MPITSFGDAIGTHTLGLGMLRQQAELLINKSKTTLHDDSEDT
jgi:hypothetical protein